MIVNKLRHQLFLQKVTIAGKEVSLKAAYALQKSRTVQVMSRWMIRYLFIPQGGEVLYGEHLVGELGLNGVLVWDPDDGIPMLCSFEQWNKISANALEFHNWLKDKYYTCIGAYKFIFDKAQLEFPAGRIKMYFDDDGSGGLGVAVTKESTLSYKGIPYRTVKENDVIVFNAGEMLPPEVSTASFMAEHYKSFDANSMELTEPGKIKGPVQSKSESSDGIFEKQEG